MLNNTLWLLFVITLFFSPLSVFCADDDSRFLLTSEDKTIYGTTPTTVLSYTLNLSERKAVLLAANGRYYPSGTKGLAVVNIRVDGNETYSNYSIIDWSLTNNAVQHSFDCIALVTLLPGTHTIELIGYNHVYTPSAGFVIGSQSGLSIMTNPAPFSISSTLGYDSPIIDIQADYLPHKGDIPAIPLVSHNIQTNSATNVATLLSGRAYCAGEQGDAMWGIYLNDQCPAGATSNLGVNDLFNEAEMAAPMYCFAMHNFAGNNKVSFKATELTWDTASGVNKIQYKVGSDVRLISLWGMGLSGSFVSPGVEACRRNNWVCAQHTDICNPGECIGCPAPGNNYTVAETTINIPDGHNGIVFFKAATRLQGSAEDEGGDVKFWLNIDGEDVGGIGVQELKSPNGLSSRTLVASYLSAGDKKLAPGPHVVKVYCVAIGTYFKREAVAMDLPLIYFD